MDVSKLPKLSQTPARPGAEGGESAGTPGPGAGEVEPGGGRMAAGPEAWFCLAIGVIVCLMNQRLFTGGAGLVITDPTRGVITYRQSYFFINDLGLVVFGLALVVEGLAMLVRQRWAVWVGLVASVGAAGMNVYTVARLYAPMGFQLLPAVAVAIAVYSAMYQWRMIRGGDGR